MIREAIVLAGGLGTRLRSVVADRPKCMAEVAGRPFIAYLTEWLRSEGIDRIVFAVGYMRECVEQWAETERDGILRGIETAWSVETEPLGTGGAVKQASEICRGRRVAVINGDTMFHASLQQLGRESEGSGRPVTIALKEMTDFDRYGTVNFDSLTGAVTSFNEKKPCERGLINGGIYVIDRDSSLFDGLPTKFSFETSVLEPQAAAGNVGGVRSDGYFIDIGIPEDFAKAQEDFRK